MPDKDDPTLKSFTRNRNLDAVLKFPCGQDNYSIVRGQNNAHFR